TCLDGDGALIMQMGGLATIGDRKPANLVHVVLNNGAHDSVGGQPTVALGIDVPALALALGYRRASTVRTQAELDAALAAEFARPGDGPALIEVRVRKGSRKDLGRPKASPEENKRALMDYLKD
ncbi:MAG TPA: thiamine pyrophosphate-dependent enzyme, partial [Treponemataceae bacterium]|nr:thiamine pyrophosphate-dependent enzyme [Treponemataceae bacterium]